MTVQMCRILGLIIATCSILVITRHPLGTGKARATLYRAVTLQVFFEDRRKH